MSELDSVVARRLAARLAHVSAMTPMRVILAEVPPVDGSATTRAARVGVSKQAWARWMEGSARPSQKTALRIAKLIEYRFSAEQIRGNEWKGRTPKKR